MCVWEAREGIEGTVVGEPGGQLRRLRGRPDAGGKGPRAGGWERRRAGSGRLLGRGPFRRFCQANWPAGGGRSQGRDYACKCQHFVCIGRISAQRPCAQRARYGWREVGGSGTHSMRPLTREGKRARLWHLGCLGLPASPAPHQLPSVQLRSVLRASASPSVRGESSSGASRFV